MASDRLLLVGAGHGHLHLIRNAERLRAAGYRIVLVAPRWFHYSGTASAIATGDLQPEQGRVDVAALARRHRVEHHVGLVVELDVAARTARTDAAVEIGWDAVSLNVGSVVDPGQIGGGGVGALSVKPLEELAQLAGRLGPRPDGRPVAVTVIGGGSSGVEIAGHTARRRPAARVTLICAGADLVPELPAGARRRLGRILAECGVTVRRGVAVREVHADHVLLADGSRVGHDVAVLATGLVAPPLIERSGLGDRAGIPVRASLQHRDHDHVYAVGDCARFLPRPLPRIGVHGVRQGPVLLEALLARAGGTAPPTYVPGERALAILDLGAGRGLAARGRWWWEGRSALWLKRWIDRRWLRRYRG